MAIFGGKKSEPAFPGLIGVDLGTAGTKLVELVPEKGRLKLSTYGYSEPKEPAGSKKSALDEKEKTVALLKKIMKEGNFKARRAVAALPTTNVFHAIITLPVPRKKMDLKPAIESQARKLLPLPLEEMVLDTNVLDKDLLPKDDSDENEVAEGKYLRVLLTGAPKKLISSVVDIFKEAGLELVSLETEVFALTRALVGKEKGRVLIVDLGAERSNLAIIDQGVPLLTRVIKTGGNAITQAFAQNMGVGFAEAETMKRDLAFTANPVLPPSLYDAVKPIVHEMRYALQMYAEQVNSSAQMPVDKVLVTGGSAHLPGLDTYLTQSLNMTVYLGDPWARVLYPPEMKQILEEIGPRFSVAVGLAERLEEKP